MLQEDPEDTKTALIRLKEEWLHYPGVSETTRELLTQVRERRDIRQFERRMCVKAAIGGTASLRCG